MIGEVNPQGYPRDRQPKRLPLGEFNNMAPNVVLSVAELVITDPQLESIFLLRRVGGEGGTEFDGLWHLPGAIFEGPERRIVAAHRTAEKELGISLVGAHVELIGDFENINGDARGAMSHYIFRADGVPPIKIMGGAYFRKLPEDLIPHQRDFLTQLASKGYLTKSLKPRTLWRTPPELVANLSSRINHFFRS